MDRGAGAQRVTIAAACGLVAGVVVALFMFSEDARTVSLLPFGSPTLVIVAHLVAATGIGAAVGWISPRGGRVHAGLLSSGMILGLLWWSVGPLTVVPLVRGEATMWTLAEARTVFPNLVAALLHGSLTGLGFAVITSSGRFRAIGSVDGSEDESPDPTRIVIVGGGFGGVAVAQRLEKHALDGSGLDVTLVSESNFLLFTPMLA